MKFKRALFIFAFIYIIGTLYAAPGEVAEGGGATSSTIGPKNFSFVFEKPTRDVFDFCAPGMPGEPLQSSAGGGLQFPIPTDDNTLGFPTSLQIGVYYELQSNCRVAVWCNAGDRHQDGHRLRLLKPDGSVDDGPESGYDYTVTVSAPGETTAQYPVSLDDPTLPVYQVFCDGLTSKNGDVTISLDIRSDKESVTGGYEYYMEGQYRGYVLLQYMSMT